VVLAGGGSEGDEGDEASWSAGLYRELLSGGDVDGDGLLRVAILSAAEETDWLPSYFRWLGADEAFNLQLDSVQAADGPALEQSLGLADAVFVKGGDQGEYYDLWNGSLAETLILRLFQERGGGVGGTSAGAMSQAEYALAGGQDLVALDVLEDACSSWLDDSDGGSAVHTDFLGTVPGALIDTHFTQRGRLGRLAGAMARAVEEEGADGLLGIGIEQETGLVIRGGQAQVHGVGAVSFLQASGDSQLLRSCGQPLIWTDLRLDRLTAGWTFDLEAGEPLLDAPPEGAEPVGWDGQAAENQGEWYAYGDLPRHEERFAWVADRAPEPYGTHAGSDPPLLQDALAILDAHDSDSRALAHEALFRALYDHVGSTGFLVARGGMLERPAERDEQVAFGANEYVSDPEAATLVLASHGVGWRSLSPAASSYDGGDGSLHAAGLTDLRLHILAGSASWGLSYDAEARAVVGSLP